jgi:predicted nucleic acid-binding protein
VRHAFFYDTWAFAALANRRDPAHDVAAELDRELERQAYVAVTSDYILDEALTLLSVSAGAKAALGFLHGFLARVEAGDIQLLQVTPGRRDRALRLFRRIAPAERRLSFTDATSFSLMHELSIQDAFTADRHFHRAGGGVRPLVELKSGRFDIIDIA